MSLRPLAVELVGTFCLVLVGAGVVALGLGGLLGAALAHGLVVVGVAGLWGGISGAHINPAVTIAACLAGALDGVAAAGYVAAQVGGGIAAALLLERLVGGIPSAAGLGATTLAAGVSPPLGLAIELVLTFVLVSVVLHGAIGGRAGRLAPLAVGLTLVALILVGGPLTGASLNPARTLGPAVALRDFGDLWVYLLGPVLGAVAAALLYGRRRPRAG